MWLPGRSRWRISQKEPPTSMNEWWWCATAVVADDVCYGQYSSILTPDFMYEGTSGARIGCPRLITQKVLPPEFPLHQYVSSDRKNRRVPLPHHLFLCSGSTAYESENLGEDFFWLEREMMVASPWLLWSLASLVPLTFSSSMSCGRNRKLWSFFSHSEKKLSEAWIF